MFNYFFSNEIKQGDATTIAHIKSIIEFLNKCNIMSNTLSTIWENTDGCDENDRCATTLYLMSMLSQEFSVIIDRGISAPGHSI